MMNLCRRSSVNVIEEQDIEKLIQNWSPPKVSSSDLYKRRGLFERKMDYEIKTIEKTELVQGEYADFQLLERSIIQQHKRKYEVLHLGSVQVAVKPLTRNGLNNSVLVCLRDCRNLRFTDSVLAIAESSLSNGPIYFNCYPSYSVSLADPYTLEVLTLNVKTGGLQGNIAVSYTVHYKVYVEFDPQAEGFSVQDPRGKKSLSSYETTFVETNLLSNGVAARRTISWDSVEVPERWTIRSDDQGHE
ncbi:hypothetical protein RJ640_028738 [Escallonia rubra]|uniref:Movement protein n=1 Tax=Escallonia rubra TaxID=112253 RepID=A0AA88RSF4_9ASTE|nr:hypothetical protein RJ640_028738 [Escallonia rubra]